MPRSSSNHDPHHRYRLIALLAVLGLLLPLVVPQLGGKHTEAAASVVFTKSDLTRQLPRGTADTVIHYAQGRGSTPLDQTIAYINEVYRLAPLVGIDPAFVLAQSALETADWTSWYWTNYLNPAGIGIGYAGAPSYKWNTGVEAARYHLVHLYVYTTGLILEGNPLYPYRADGPGYSAVIRLGYVGTGKTINDLTGRWAEDPNYGTIVALRGNTIYGSAPVEPVAMGLPVARVDASAGNDPWRTRDRLHATTFAVTGIGVAPPGVFVTYDLGRRANLERIQWLFRRGDGADSYAVQYSNNLTTWATMGNYVNPVADTWIKLQTTASARYVRFMFANPNSDMTVGYLSEVEFYGVNATGILTPTSTPYAQPTATGTLTATATATPLPGLLPGDVLPIVATGASGSGNWSGYLRDGLLTTTWQTIAIPAPASAQIFVDLGSVGPINGIRTYFRRNSGARSVEIRVSDDKVAWRSVGSLPPVTTMAWQATPFQVNARFVQLIFRNTTGVAALGYLAEIQVFGTASGFGTAIEPTMTSTATATQSPTATATATMAISTITATELIPMATASATATVTSDVPGAASPVADVVDQIPVAVDTEASPVALDAVEVPIRTIARSGNSTSAAALLDRDPATVWQATGSDTAPIVMEATLDGAVAVGQLALLPGTAGFPPTILIAVTADGVTWTPIVAPPNWTPDGWGAVSVNATITAVRITVPNVDGGAQATGIAEIRLSAPVSPEGDP